MNRATKEERGRNKLLLEAYVRGVSTRKVDDLVKALGLASGISKSEVSRICRELDRDVKAFRDRPLDHAEFVYVLLDAAYVKGRVRGRVVSRAVVIATGSHDQSGGHAADPHRRCRARAQRHPLQRRRPGFIETPMTARNWTNPDGTIDEEKRTAMIQTMGGMAPLKRTGEPIDIAYAVLYLAADASRFVTGQVVRPNGGVVM